jgi:hypothetical protein
VDRAQVPGQRNQRGLLVMRILVAGLVALALIAGIAGPTYATVGKSVAKQKVDRLNSQGPN